MKIAFYGATGSSDFGDYAMMVHNIQSLLHRFPELEIMIFTPDKYTTLSNLVCNFQDITLLNRITIENELDFVTCLREKVLSEFFQRIVKHDLFSEHRFKELQNGDMSFLNTDLISKINSVDMLLFNGGGYIQHSWGRKNYCFLASIIVAHRYNVPVYFLGNSFGPMGKYEQCFAHVIKNVNFVLLRDGENYSKRLLDSCGFYNYTYGPDDLLFCYENYSLKKLYDNYVVVEIMHWIHKAKKGAAYVINELYKFIDYLTARGKNIILINLDNNDTQGKAYIDSLFSRLNNRNIISYTTVHSIYEVFSIYYYCDFSLSFRYHPIILSLSNNKPCLGVICDNDGYYEGKLKGAFETCNIPVDGHVIHIDEFNADYAISCYREPNECYVDNLTKESLIKARDEYIEMIFSNL